MSTTTPTPEQPAAEELAPINPIMPMEQATIEYIELREIHPSPTNPRQYFDPASLLELRASIRAHGFMAAFPLLVRPLPDGTVGYEIIAGERRYRSAKEEGITTVPVVVEDMDDRKVLALQVVENVQRKALTPLEEGRAYERMKDAHNYTLEQIAALVGLAPKTITQRIKMLRAPSAMLDALAKGEVGERQCLLVAAIPDKAMREEAGERVLEGTMDHRDGGTTVLTVSETKRLIRETYMVSLKGCNWTLDDVELRPEAGRCIDCKWLAKNNPDLQDDLQSGGKGKGGIDPMTCTSPTCYGQKLEAYWQRKQAEAKAGKVKVLTATETKKVFYEQGHLRHDAGYVKLSEKPGHDITGSWDDSKTPSYGQLVKEANAKPDIVIARAPDGKVVELMPRKVAAELAKSLKAAGKLKAKKEEPTAAEKKEKERLALANKVAAREKLVTLQVIHDRIGAQGIGLDGQRVILRMMLDHAGMDGCRLMAEWLHLKPEGKKALDQNGYRALILTHMEGQPKEGLERMAVIAFVSKYVKQGYSFDYTLKPLAAHYGFKAADIKATATQEVKAELEAKKAKGKGKGTAKDSAKPVVNDGMMAGKTISGADVDTSAQKKTKPAKKKPKDEPAPASQGDLVFEEDPDVEARERIVAYKEKHPKTSVGGIADELGIDVVTVGRICDALIDEEFAPRIQAEKKAKEIAALNAEWLALKKPAKSASKEEQNEWAKARMRIKRALQKHGLEVPAK